MKKKLILFILLCSFTRIIVAQSLITGKVSAEDNTPLVGVTVSISGTPRGTLTDLDGMYKIEANKGEVLSYTLIGMVSQQILVESQNTINVILKEDAIVLDEVVAIGYGVAKKIDLSSSISSVKGEDLTNLKIGSATDALQGLASGVLVNKSSFKPGGTSSVLIRGVGSFGNGGAGSNPLYVIDGIQSTGGLDFISPSDIESMQVLKDAAATAIYGSRASNGVILITTKKGATGKTKISFSSNFGMQNLANKQDVVNAEQYKMLLDEASGGTKIWDSEELNMIDKGQSTDWQDLISQTGIYQNYNLGVSGGGQTTNYYVGLDWVDQTGVIKNTGFEKASIRFNLDTKLTSWLSMDLKMNVIRSTTNSSNTDGVAGMNSLDQGTMGSAVASRAIAPVYNADGSYYDKLELRPNPVAANTYFKNKFNQTRVIGSIGFEAEVIKGLKLRTENGGELIYNISNVFQDSRMTGIYKNVNIADRSNGEQVQMQSENTATYQLNMGDHNITAVGGFSAQVFNWDFVSMQVLDASNITQGHALGSGTPKYTSSDKVKSALASQFLRVNYSYSDKYLLSLSLRNDGSSKFAKGNKWGIFPAGSLAWRINNEEFLKKVDELSNLKLRLSYGVVGNPEIGAYQSWAIVNANSGVYNDYLFGNTLAAGSDPTRLRQPGLTWEKAKQFDVGLDLGFFNNRISASLDYYDKLTYDLLYYMPLPLESAYGRALVNIGEMRNKGVEVQLNTVNIATKDFTWETTFNYSFNKNTVEKLHSGKDRDNNLFVGKPIDVIYTKRFGGIWQQDEAKIAEVYGSEPGDIKIVDRNRNNIIDDGDREFIGQSSPQFFGSFGNTIRYKGFDFLAYLTYAGGHMIYNPFAYLNTYSPSGNMSVDYYNNYWTPQRPSNLYPRLGSTSSPLYETEGVYQKGDYIRLKNLEIGYTLPTSIARKVFASKIRFSVSAQNLITFTDYTGFDVETSNANPYPASRAFVGGISINF